MRSQFDPVATVASGLEGRIARSQVKTNRSTFRIKVLSFGPMVVAKSTSETYPISHIIA
jgi:hypothetical protein